MIAAVQQASWDLGDADALGVSQWAQDAIRVVDLEDTDDDG